LSKKKYSINLVAVNPKKYSLALGYLEANLLADADLKDRVVVKSFVFDEEEIQKYYFDYSFFIYEITENEPDIIGFSVYLWNQQIFKTVVNSLARLFPHIKIVLGGPQFADKNIEWDFYPRQSIIVMGEGESALLGVVKCVLEHKTMDNIPGIAFFKGGNWVINRPGAPQDLSRIVSPIINGSLLFDPQKWVPAFTTSRGCRYRCSYCNWQDGFGVRFFPLQQVEKELQILAGKGVKRLWFTDCLFGIDEGRYIKILEMLCRWPHDCEFAFETRAELITSRLIDYFLKINVAWLAVGIQSFNPNALNEVNRSTDLKNLLDTLDLLADSGFPMDRVHADLIFGLPGDSLPGMQKTIDFLRQRYPDLTFFFEVLKVLPGTAIWNRALKEKWLIHSSENMYDVIQNNAFCFNDIISLKYLGLGLDFLQAAASRQWWKQVLESTSINYSDLAIHCGKYLHRMGAAFHHEYERNRWLEKKLRGREDIFLDLAQIINRENAEK
jgi:radical SAM superfamily enzyme YgiQ (UPF0313 family)